MNKEQLNWIDKPEIKSEMEKRLDNAKELGRICPDEIPDFIGNFLVSERQGNLQSNPKGIFEMTIIKKDEDGNFEGTTKDYYGDGVINGMITDSEIHFTKKYITEKYSIGASKLPLIYEGFFDFSSNYDFIGSWKYEGAKNFNGNFYLSKDILTNL